MEPFMIGCFSKLPLITYAFLLFASSYCVQSRIIKIFIKTNIIQDLQKIQQNLLIGRKNLMDKIIIVDTNNREEMKTTSQNLMNELISSELDILKVEPNSEKGKNYVIERTNQLNQTMDKIHALYPPIENEKSQKEANEEVAEDKEKLDKQIAQNNSTKDCATKQLWNLCFQYNFRQGQVHKTVIPKEMLFQGIKKLQEKDLLRLYWESFDDIGKLILF